MFKDLPSKVVAAVNAEELTDSPWGAAADSRRHAKFVSYALAAAAEALDDADWHPPKEAGLRATGKC